MYIYLINMFYYLHLAAEILVSLLGDGSLPFPFSVCSKKNGSCHWKQQHISIYIYFIAEDSTLVGFGVSV
jgi:hypothetical protein